MGSGFSLAGEAWLRQTGVKQSSSYSCVFVGHEALASVSFVWDQVRVLFFSTRAGLKLLDLLGLGLPSQFVSV